MGEGKIRVGLTGWSDGAWRGTLFPADATFDQQLALSSEVFPTCELMSTYHAYQPRTHLARWASVVHDRFTFSVKGLESLSNAVDLTKKERALDNFFGQGLTELGTKLGPILWQFAPRKPFSYSELRRFIYMLPETLEGRPLRHVFDARHPSFDDPAFTELCRDNDIAVCYSLHPEYALLDEPDTSFRYVRIFNTVDEEPLGLAPDEFDALVEKVAGWSQSGRDVYVYFTGGSKARNPVAAQAFRDRLDS